MPEGPGPAGSPGLETEVSGRLDQWWVVVPPCLPIHSSPTASESPQVTISMSVEQVSRVAEK